MTTLQSPFNIKHIKCIPADKSKVASNSNEVRHATASGAPHTVAPSGLAIHIPALPAPGAPKQLESKKSVVRAVLAKYLIPSNWTEPVKDTLIWFMFGLMLTTLISRVVPGYPILVGTESIPKGVYWLNKNVGLVKHDDTLTFDFKPKEPWVAERYGTDRVFTKYVKGLPGDVVSLTKEDVLQVCRHPSTAGISAASRCETLGAIRKRDSKGREMRSWIKAGEPYTIKANEVWIYGPHVRSLDSRYYGPIPVETIHGRATPLLTW